MTKKSRGFRSGTRNKLKQHPSKRPAITKFLKEFELEDKVVIYQEPSSHKGMPFSRYKGRTGRIVEKRGNGYMVEIADGKKKKLLLSKAEHLRKV